VRASARIEENLYWYSKDKPVSSLFFRGYSVNVFAIDQGDEIWLIDAGVTKLGRPNRLVKCMRRDGLDPARIKKIFLTHAHPDHAAATGFFANRFDASIYIHKDERAALSGGSDYLWTEETRAARGMLSTFYPAPMWLVKVFMKYSIGETPRTANARLLESGEIVRGQKEDLMIIHTPGHVAGHACYYSPKLKAAFLGDLIDPSFDHKASLNFPASDYDAICQSIEKMASLDTKIICAAHAKEIITGAESSKTLYSGTLAKLNDAYRITVDLLKQAMGMRLKDFAGHYPKETWLLQDQICVPFSIIKSLEKKGKVRFDSGKFFYRE